MIEQKLNKNKIKIFLSVIGVMCTLGVANAIDPVTSPAPVPATDPMMSPAAAPAPAPAPLSQPSTPPMPGMDNSGMSAGMPGSSPMSNGMPGLSPMSNGMPGLSPMSNGMPGLSPMSNGMPGSSPMSNGMPGSSQMGMYNDPNFNMNSMNGMNGMNANPGQDNILNNPNSYNCMLEIPFQDVIIPVDGIVKFCNKDVGKILEPNSILISLNDDIPKAKQYHASSSADSAIEKFLNMYKAQNSFSKYDIKEAMNNIIQRLQETTVANAELEKYVVRVPEKGAFTLSEPLKATEGSFLRANTVVSSMGDYSQLKIVIIVPSTVTVTPQLLFTAKFYSDPNKFWKVKPIGGAPIIEAATQTKKIYAAITEPMQINIGQYGTGAAGKAGIV